MSDKRINIIASSLLLIITILSFYHLFFPKISLFSTPDFGESDIWQLNLPNKFFLSQSLKNGQWPLWNPYIGNGFPTLAEGQIGTFNFFNLLLFRFLPFALAYNIGYIILFSTAAIGTYFYCREVKISKISSFLAGILFAFSGTFITHISHYNLIQAASFIPWIFLFGEKLIYNRHIKWGILLSLVISQQIFSGFPQLVFITLLGFILYLLFFLKTSKKNRNSKLKLMLSAILFMILGFSLSSIQLLPQKEFLDASTRAGGFDSKTATAFSYPFKHLITFVFPYKLGNPRIGSYPSYTNFDGSIFWENTGYIGKLPLVLACIAILFLHKNRKIFFFIILLITSFLLMTGKYSPFYFIFPLPPFSYFRVPSRFIFLFVWSLVLLSAFGLDKVLIYFQKLFKSQLRYLSIVLPVIIVIICGLDLFSFAYFYNPRLPADELLSKPEIISALKGDKFFSFGSGPFWNSIFLFKGWQKPEDYLFFKNALLANQNVIYNLRSINAYPAQNTRRYEIILEALNNLSPANFSAASTAGWTNLLQIYNIPKIITPIKFPETSKIKRVYETAGYANIPGFSVYNLSNSRPDVYLTDNYQSLKYVSDLFGNISKLDDAPKNQIFLESQANITNSSELLVYQLSQPDFLSTGFNININANKDAFLVINNSVYPGWHALVNGKSKNIIPANLNQMAIEVPKGKSEINVFYDPLSFKTGKLITLGSFTILMILTFLQLVYRRFREIL